jgi:hypothetical protein
VSVNRRPDESWSDYYRRVRLAVDAREALRLADSERMLFLDRLYNCKLIIVTEWETHFIHDLVTERRELSYGQRDCIDELRQKYERRLNKISPATTSPRSCANGLGQPNNGSEKTSPEAPANPS